MKKVISILTVLLLCFPGYSQDYSNTENLTDSLTEQKSKQIEIYFDQGRYAIDLNLKNNRNQFENFEKLIDELQADTLTTISKIEISSYTSPEGGRSYNNKLSTNRVNAIYNYLVNNISVPDSIITKLDSGTDWEGLYSAVQASDVEHKSEILDIIESVPEETWRKVNPTDKWSTLVDSRLKHLMELKGGNSYHWIYNNIFPQLRRGAVTTVYFETILPPTIEEPAPIKPDPIEPQIEPIPTAPTAAEPIVEAPIVEVEPTVEEIKPLLALKTNLLFDAATLLNVEVEVPIGERWSVAGEWVFPWWTWDDGTSQSKRSCLQLLNANVEGKYWFGDRTDRPQLTGWFASLYAGGGLYDFERNAKGYQGEFFIAAGVGVGYAHTINKSGSLRMEYSTGIGYLKTNYRYYESIYDIDSKWHAIRQVTGNYTWFGPTRARVSLVWLLTTKKRGGAQ